MEGWLKALIATACVVVISGGAYFAFTQYQSWSRAREIQNSRDGARDELFQLAGAKPWETDRVRTFCQMQSDRRYKQNDKSEIVQTLVRNCNGLGLMP